MKKKVLVLEDQGGILFTVAERLSDAYEVVPASDLYTATQALEESSFDALVVDLNMDPAGLDPELYEDTNDGQLTGWIWLRQYPEYYGKTVLYSAYLASLASLAGHEDAELLKGIVQISKREQGHVDAVIAAIRKITQESK